MHRFFYFRNFQSVNNYDQPNSELNSETENLQDWILIVKHVVARDSGFYECQVYNVISIPKKQLYQKIFSFLQLKS